MLRRGLTTAGQLQDKVGGILAYAICNPNVIDKVDAGHAEEIARLLKDGVSTEEFAAAQKGYLESMKVSRGSDAGVAKMLQDGLYLGRTFAFTAEMQKKIAALEAKDVNRALAAHIDPNRLVVVRAGDFTKKRRKRSKDSVSRLRVSGSACPAANPQAANPQAGTPWSTTHRSSFTSTPA